MDASDPRHDEQIAAVHEILGGLGLGEKRRVLVMNKIDRLPAGEGAALAHRAGGVAVSAASREGLADLLHACNRHLWADGRVPFAEVEAGAPRPPPPDAAPAPEQDAAAPPSAAAPSPPEPPRLLPATLRRVS